ncbi:Mitochondrial translation factor ATP22 [Wickerhamomyces ciferrii]|uniref:Mitochondrial translation factor ATP22 n=1 Tax=Wickerhamomyces ciferrii (strain ATCC 14091 / BCRC 22168 / CBS 111 / JCM 3599 / NBRC 0793 / NRRL Y-1031 F-60-10) TaxID=1206466 RepID=K0KTS4_WICCF|nr:Mitochondrial translation factor ATP22 [Wickerhamomyces ciferrii]CCH45427.1 Mitochondrial translation factor ATP22 [Wickerhamomyces ciferrii]
MLASKLSRIRLLNPRIPRGFRLIHGSDEKPNTLELKRQRSTILPPLDQTQFVSEKDSLQREILSYDQIRSIISKSKLLQKKESPFKPTLVRFLEIELLKIASEQFDDFDKFYDLFYDLMKILRKNKELQKYIESNLTNISNLAFNMLMNQKYYSLFMNKEITLVLLNSDLQNEEKIQRVESLLKVSYKIKQQFIRKDVHQYQELTISSRNLKSIMNILSREHYLNFFVQLIEFDIHQITSPDLQKLRNELLHGDNTEQQVYQFQALRTVEDEETKNLLRTKFLTIYSYGMIRAIVIKYIQESNNEMVDFYMDFLMAKYAMTRELPHVNSRELTQNLYEVITYQLVKLKHYNSAIELLETMKQHGLTLTPKLLHILAVSFRTRKMFDETLLILKKIAELFNDKTVGIDDQFKKLISNELLITIREQFPGEPKILISQFLSMFEGSEILLNELGIINLIHDGHVKKLVDLDGVLAQFYKSEISDIFKANCFPDMHNITEIYIAVLNYISVHSFVLPKEDIYRELFNLAMDHISKVQELDFPDHPFSKQNLDEALVNLFVKNVLEINVDLALDMLKRSLQTCTFKRFTGESASRILAKLENADSTEIEIILALFQELKESLGFHALTALCLRAARFDDFDQARFWYDKILALGEPLTHYRLIKLAVQMEWELPKDFDTTLLEKEFQYSAERELSFKDERVFIDDPEFAELVSSTLQKFEN